MTRRLLLLGLLIALTGCGSVSTAYYDDRNLFSLPPAGFIEGNTLVVRTYRPTSMKREVRTVKADLVGEEVHVYAPEVVDISLPRRDRDHQIPLPASHLTPSLAERIYWINPDGTKERMQIEDTR